MQLSDAIDLNSRFTQAEAYAIDDEDGQLNLLEVNLRFNTLKEQKLNVSLYQNRPNPFKENTVIGFVLPEATNATLSVYDVSGKLLKEVFADFEKGYNEVSLDGSDLSGGLLYYQLVSSNYSLSKKMLKMD